MKNTAFLTFITLFVTLSGCGLTGAQVKALRIKSLANDALKQSLACHATIKSKPEYARIYEKMAVVLGEEPTKKQLTDISKPTDEDIALGLEWYAEYEDCQKSTIEQWGRIDPKLAEIGITIDQERAKLVSEIVSEQPTYGHINKEILHIKIESKLAVKQWASSLASRLQYQHEQELEDRAQFWSDAGEVTETTADVLLDMVSTLGHQQGRLIHSQHLFAASHHFYKPTHLITETKCRYVGKTFTCKQI